MRTIIKLKKNFIGIKSRKLFENSLEIVSRIKRTKTKLRRKRGIFNNMSFQQVRFLTVGIDLFGRLTETPRKNKCTILLIDFYSKWIEAEPLKNMRSTTIAEWFVNSVGLRHDAIERVLTGKGKIQCSRYRNLNTCRPRHITRKRMAWLRGRSKLLDKG